MSTETNAKKEMRTSLARRLCLLTGCVIVLLNVIQLLSVTTNAKKDILKEDLAMYNNIASVNAAALRNDLEGYFKELNGYVHADVMQTGDLEACFEWIQDPKHAKMRGDFDYILFAGPDGKARTDLGGITDIAERDYFKDIFQRGKERTIDDPVIGKTTGKPVIHITRAVKDSSGRTFAMVSGVLNVETLTEAISQVKVGDNGYGFLLASTGLVIAHPETSFVMEKNFITGITGGKSGRNGDMIAVAEAMTRGERGEAWINANGREGKDLIVYNPVDGTPWSFALSIPDHQIYELINNIRYMLIAFAVAITVALCVIIGVLLVRSLKPLAVVEKAISDIASGDADLTRRIAINSTNEIGQVVKGFNQFTGKLHAIISDVKDSKSDLTVAGDDMSASAQDTAASITEIIANIESMQHQITNQNASVDETAGAVNQIASNITSLEHMIEMQSSGVTQASAAVEEMIGNITSVNQSVDKMASSFGALQQNAQSGIGKQQAVNERIQQIEQLSAGLQEANAAISAIAEQTNLLAMNAAIEAAHAGDAGKGFSVVADEIRKLSETSTSQSKTIGDQLNNIKDAIAEVVTASQDSSSAFESVSRLIKETDQLVTQIKSAMEEQQEGSQQITEALHSMNDSTVEVRNAAGEMSEGNKAILNEVRRLQEVTSAMKGSMEEMSVGARKINETGAALSSISDKVKESIVQIGNQIDQFRV